jgi:uncharacterized OsmC-like protein
MSDTRTHHVTLNLARGFEFVATFPDLPNAQAILLDEPPPLGGDSGPNAAAVLGVAVGNCLAASLAFCLRKARVDVEGLTANVSTHVERDEHNKLRITGIDVDLAPEIAGADPSRLERCEDLFEDFCIVTESVRRGIPVNVTVKQREVAGAV